MPIESVFNDHLPNLKKDNIFMKNPNNVFRKIEQIRRDGRHKLQVVSDFDRTLTKQHVDGRLVESSFEIFYKCKQLPSSIVEAADVLYDKYRPMEMDPDLDHGKKVAAMESWMTESEKILRGVQFDSCEIDEVAKIYGTSLREGTHDLFRKLEKADIPILVFSAGLGDVVKAVLNNHDILLKNVKIVSNFLKYNNDKLDGFKNDPLIHVFNKNEKILDHDSLNILQGRSNVLLMGDMTGDSTMADGIKDTATILKIGFLYENVSKCLPSYLEAFDIVLVDDQTMDIATDIVARILSQ